VTKSKGSIVARVWSHSAIRYLFVGGLCFVADVAGLWLLHDIWTVPLAVATPVSFLASFALTYTLQRVVAFASDARVAPSVGRYTALVVVNTIATTGIVWLTDAVGAGWMTGKVVAVVATTVWNYFAYRYWVFSPRQDGNNHV